MDKVLSLNEFTEACNLVLGRKGNKEHFGGGGSACKRMFVFLPSLQHSSTCNTQPAVHVRTRRISCWNRTVKAPQGTNMAWQQRRVMVNTWYKHVSADKRFLLKPEVSNLRCTNQCTFHTATREELTNCFSDDSVNSPTASSLSFSVRVVISQCVSAKKKRKKKGKRNPRTRYEFNWSLSKVALIWECFVVTGHFFVRPSVKSSIMSLRAVLWWLSTTAAAKKWRIL